jgi:signal transduction histidine kinase
VVALLTNVHHQISDLLREMPTTAASEVARLGLVAALSRAVEEELSRAFDEVTWQIEPEAERHARAIPTLTAEVLFYATREAIRNAAHHGRTDRVRLSLSCYCLRDGLSVEDTGGVGRLVVNDGGSGLGLA